MQKCKGAFVINNIMTIFNEETQTFNFNNNQQYDDVVFYDKKGNLFETFSSFSNTIVSSANVLEKSVLQDWTNFIMYKCV
jgi:hypothetical protein